MLVTTRKKHVNSRERGFALVVTVTATFALLGATAIAVDLGRMYIVKNELQAYADAAALAAAIELDGTGNGIARAENAAAASTNRVNFGLGTVTSPIVEFATATAPDAWVVNPGVGANSYTRVRVNATTRLQMMFMAVTGNREAAITARAVASQVSQPGYRNGTLPFAPYAHPGAAGPHYGMVPGQMHTLRWPASANKDPCIGDNTAAVKALHEQSPSDFRGYIDNRSASSIRVAIERGDQDMYRQIGDAVSLTNGAQSTQFDSIQNRVLQDTDSTSTTYAAYLAAGRGNGRRVVGAPIQSGNPGGYRIVQWGAFFLREPSYYDPSGGNVPLCAEYIGPYVENADNSGATSSATVRLAE